MPANDPHYNAKLWTHLHPYGTGSLLSEVGSGGVQHLARNRLTLIQSSFRRSPLYGFWASQRIILTELFFKNKNRQAAGRVGASAKDDPDAVTRLFGSVQPGDIPETSEWWKHQERDLFAVSDPAEYGLMQAMVTVRKERAQ